jgi:hypothetical protein
MNRLRRLLEATGTAEGTTESFSDPTSLSGQVEAVHRAFSAAFPSDDDGPYNYVEEVYDDAVLARIGKATFSVPYTYTPDADDAVTFGEQTRVRVQIVAEPVTEAAPAGAPAGTATTPAGAPERFTSATNLGGTILESLDEGEGWVWRVTLVRPGISHNGRRYTPEVLGEAIQLYEGVRAFDGHRDQAERKRSAIANLAGHYENVLQEGDGRLTADFRISSARDDIRQQFLSAWKAQRPNLFGFSHDVSAFAEAATVGGRRISDVRKIVEVHSVDIVADPSAGGRLERLVASRQEEDPMELTDFLRRLRAGELTSEQLTEAYEAHPEWEQIAEAIDEARTTAGEPAAGDPPAAPTRVQEAGGLGQTMVGLLVRAATDGMPEAAVTQISEALAERETVTEEDITTLVESTRTIWDAALAAAPSPLPGQGNVQVGQEDEEKRRHALDAMIAGEREVEGTPAFRSLKEAYVAFTGRNPYAMGEEDFNRWILAESVGGIPYAGAQRLSESIESGTWAEAFGDSIRRRLVREYALPELNAWRQIVSDIGNLTDFRTNRRVRIGGYDVLPTVGEGAPYQPLTSPEDEEATYAPTKKGGTEDWTLEAIANDDLTSLRKIPRSLGRAAALTLYRAIFNTTIAGNATVYDSVALFHDGSHANDNATTPLAEAGIALLRQRMVRQKQQGEDSGFIGITPRFLLTPPELYVTAFKLTRSNVAVVGSDENATTPNPWQGLMPIEVPTFTDTDDWFLVADPASVETIEVGFYQGRQEPELFVQDQPNVGAVFTADKFTWKIRHIWGLAVIDYRGFQRGVGS